MRPCAFANAVTGGALLVAGAVASCGGPSAPPEAAGASEPAAKPPRHEARSSSAGTSPSGTEATSDRAAAGEGRSAGGAKRDPGEIQRVILAHREPVRRCYEEAHAKSPGLKGTLTMALVIRPDGTVKTAQVNAARSDIVTPAVVSCAAQVLSKLHFGRHPSGMESAVNYPFDFRPPN